MTERRLGVPSSASTRLAVHVLGVDPERRVLLDRPRPPQPPHWGMPTAVLAVGEDPLARAHDLVTHTGSLTATRLEVIDLESTVDDGAHVVHLVFECGVEPGPSRLDGQSTALWWTLPEIVDLRLSPRTRRALASRWSLIWPDT